MLHALLVSVPWAGVLVYFITVKRDEQRALIETQEIERESHRQEIGRLLNRIQCPAQEIAVVAAEQHRSDTPLFVGFDDDEDFAKAREELRS